MNWKAFSVCRSPWDVKPARWLRFTHIILRNSRQSQGYLSDSQQEATWTGDKQLASVKAADRRSSFEFGLFQFWIWPVFLLQSTHLMNKPFTEFSHMLSNRLMAGVTCGNVSLLCQIRSITFLSFLGLKRSSVETCTSNPDAVFLFSWLSSQKITSNYQKTQKNYAMCTRIVQKSIITNSHITKEQTYKQAVYCFSAAKA